MRVCALLLVLLVSCTAREPASPRPLDLSPLSSSWDSIAVAAGLHPLRLARTHGQQREIRIWVSYGLGSDYLYRFVQHADTTSGEAIRHWGIGDESAPPSGKPGDSFALRSYDPEGDRCVWNAPLGQIGTCKVRFAEEPDWRTVLRNAVDAGLWSLAAPAANDDPPVTPGWMPVRFDGPMMIVEVLEPSGYHRAHLPLPRCMSERVGERQAADLLDVISLPADTELFRHPSSVRRCNPPA